MEGLPDPLLLRGEAGEGHPAVVTRTVAKKGKEVDEDVAEVADEEPKDEPLLEKKDRTGKTKEDQDGLHTSCGRLDGNSDLFIFQISNTFNL